MGYFKQLHIDCTDGDCIAGQYDTCYMQKDNPAYYRISEADIDPTEPPENTNGSDRDPNIDIDRA